MATRKIPLRQRLIDWAGTTYYRAVWAGRRRHEPQRTSAPYARAMNIGGFELSDKRPMVKPTPANLRRFGKTVFARRAIRRIKDPIAALHWEIGPKQGVAESPELDRQIAIATACFEEPNLDDSHRSFIEQLVEDLLTVGAGCYEHEVGGDPARPFWAWPVDAMSIQINPKWEGNDADPRYYQTLGVGNIGAIQGVALRNSELVYARMDPTTEHPFGLGPLEVAFNAISRKLGVSDYAGKLASNAQPENLLMFPGMSSEDLLAARDYWRNEIEGQGQTPILSAPIDSKPGVLKLRGTDDSALFIQYQELLIREIATAFCVSPMSLGVQNDVNRSTAEVVDDMDWDNAVVPAATLLSAYITRESLHGRLGFTQLEHRFLGLKRDDKEAEANIFAKEYQANAITPNEYRARNNMPPMEGIWGDRTNADFQIAMQAARGTGEIDDPDLPPPRPGSKPAAGKKPSK